MISFGTVGYLDIPMSDFILAADNNQTLERTDIQGRKWTFTPSHVIISQLRTKIECQNMKRMHMIRSTYRKCEVIAFDGTVSMTEKIGNDLNPQFIDQ